MNSAVRLALALIQKYCLEGPPGVYQLYRIAGSEGIILTRFPFKGRVRGRYMRTGDGIALLTVKKGLSRPELKHMLAYGLGQHCLNVTSGIYVDGLSGKGEEENAAEDFAALLLLPPGTVSAVGGFQGIHEVADAFHVPAPLVRRRFDLEERLAKREYMV
ncbi:hypothetical protein GFC01_13505 [Desulfofundulus thermobenzoicus]|uniref:ImmA/IrrE family metallo-endopeptidase n=1 Tax=Desulfofundulus thermobenzoicus TaxID=29376 RepID=A0A6N7IT08_9FIRM|nr:hypothetical protein [Desulfofundulus thermobenzoicus]MQL53255.1 hypothetical protein [Desulfofundulus thermobenzoicus]